MALHITSFSNVRARWEFEHDGDAGQVAIPVAFTAHLDRALSPLEAELLGGASRQQSRFSVVATEESNELLVTTRTAKDVKDCADWLARNVGRAEERTINVERMIIDAHEMAAEVLDTWLRDQ
jgi:hypothetical protein